MLPPTDPASIVGGLPPRILAFPEAAFSAVFHQLSQPHEGRRGHGYPRTEWGGVARVFPEGYTSLPRECRLLQYGLCSPLVSVRFVHTILSTLSSLLWMQRKTLPGEFRVVTCGR